MDQRIDGDADGLGGAWSVAVAVAAVLLTGLVVLPCLVPTTPVLYFESDPRVGVGGLAADVLTELGPSGVAWLQTITTLVAAAGLVVAVAAGARLSRVATALTLIGIAAVLFHMNKATARWEDWTQGGAWIAAAMTGLAAMHLAYFEVARRWVVALCAALAVPLLAEAAWYVFIEHPESVAFFEEHREDLLAARGLEPGSEAATLYERRLRFADATGTFGLSNVLASVGGTLGLLGVGLILGGVIQKRESIPGRVWVRVAAGLAWAAGFSVVGLTASKGAAVAVAAGVGLAVSVVFFLRFKPLSRHAGWLVPALGSLLVALAFSAVLVRGAGGAPAPPAGGFVPHAEIDGERSLLFRYHYWTGAARIAAEHPVMGSGARGFADRYPATKPAINPETVTSTHSVFVDQVTMLGLGGWGWAVLMVWWLWRAGRALVKSGEDTDRDDRSEPSSRPLERRAMWVATAAAVLVFGLVLVVRQPSLYLDSALLWLVAAGGFVAVAGALGSPGVVSARMQRAALFLAAAVLLIHNQVEMAFFQPTSMGVLWLLLGAAGAETRSRSSERSVVSATTESAGVGLPKAGLAGGAFPGLLVVIVMGIYSAGVLRHESVMRGAEAALVRGDSALAVSRLAEAESAAGLDTRALTWRVRLHAMEPLAWASQSGRADAAKPRLNEAMSWIEDAAPAGDPPLPVARLRASVLRAMAEGWPSEVNVNAADTAYAALAEKSPFNVQDRLAWADLLWAAGRREEARQRYREVLELRELKYLDPADPLTPEALDRVRAALHP